MENAFKINNFIYITFFLSQKKKKKEEEKADTSSACKT